MTQLYEFDLIADDQVSSTVFMLACPSGPAAGTTGRLLRQIPGHTSHFYEESLCHAGTIHEGSCY